MNTIVEKLIKEIKSKSPAQWTINELEEFTFEIRTIYKYGDSLVEKDELRVIFDKIAKLINSSKAYTRVNPGALDHIDKHNK